MFEPNVKVYNPADHDFSWGHIIIKGFAKGTFIKVTPAADDTEDENGVDGEVMVAMTNDQRADIEFTLMKSSATNLELSLARNQGIQAGRVLIMPMALRDGNGNAVYEGDNTWIKARPENEIASGVTSIKWMLRVAHLNSIEGNLTLP
jgi:hypothetical protein